MRNTRRSRAVAVLWDGHMLRATCRIAFSARQCYRELIEKLVVYFIFFFSMLEVF